VLVEAGDHVGVQVHRDAGVGVAEHFADDLGMDPRREQQRGRGVPQVVEANLRQAEALEQRVELALQRVLRVERAAVAGGEDEVQVAPLLAGSPAVVLLPPPLFAQRVHRRRRQLDPPHRTGGFRLGKDRTAVGGSNQGPTHDQMR